jgi:hypothetical protein
MPMRMPVVSESFRNYPNGTLSNQSADGRWKGKKCVGVTVNLLTGRSTHTKVKSVFINLSNLHPLPPNWKVRVQIRHDLYFSLIFSASS